jgi:hypothetical protein
MHFDILIKAFCFFEYAVKTLILVQVLFISPNTLLSGQKWVQFIETLVYFSSSNSDFLTGLAVEGNHVDVSIYQFK